MTPNPSHSAAELLRLIHNLIRLGTIAEVDHKAVRVRVAIGELLTDWLPWIEQRAGTTRDWNPPTIGEQAIVFSPGGDIAAAVALSGINSAAHPAPSSSPDKWLRKFPDGAVIEYDHAASHLQATLPGSAGINAQGAVEITTAATLTATASGGATLNANTIINGNLTLNGNFSQPSGQTATMAGDVAFTGAVTSNGKDISANHKHKGVQSGSSNSGGVV
ncbi:phage baseplate assembly protein V [Halomonas sp. M20]|uniref:phage baseplate assembly protein V n=1 Tax=Halomonas sp. M20 TaxID=2763264 RepID=UPI001D0A8495|nr:phage baseplate assembly protein V [Halomonas sp. M20]